MWVIDRFEGDKAVIECQNQTFTIPKKTLPKKVEEGDFLKVTIDHEGTERVQDDIDKLKEELFE
ncbi:DUF3006 domain-containing protein [Halanaerobacter jeridensis]|uniref:DUF3006 domain-containing protein n=1 Tax=Halanaerobacter jeridensis TaxID=706427 RepID=A0A938XSL7_9FIRM|nr:DUF3006 domain-containing protein [Halanaerobacter jeridensis]MBM7556084.1 hypothetical protein [Halanaerobacter jeridensis]